MANTEVIKVLLQFREELSKNIRPAISAMDKFQARTETLRSAMTPLSIASAGFLTLATKNAFDFSKALKDAKKGLNLTNDELKDFANQAKQISENLNFQVGSEQIAKIATEAGKLGVAKSQLASYTEGLVKLAVATDQLKNIEDLNTNVAKINSVFKMGIPDLEKYYGAVNMLADSTSANPQELIRFTQQIAGTASSARISAKDISAWGATLIDAGQQSGEAATFIRNFSVKLGAAENQSKKARAAFEVLGYSAKGLATAFQKDAQGSMIQFLERVKELQAIDPVEANRVMASVFGMENISNANLLLGKLDDLKKNLKLVGNDQANAAKMAKEFEVSSEGLDGALRAMKNVLTELSIEVGTAFLPGIVKAATATLEFIKPILAFVRANPAISTTIATLLGIVAVIAPMMHLVGVISSVLTALPLLVTGVTAVTAAMGGVLAGVGAFATATTPVIGIIAAIAGGAYLIYSNWSPIIGWFSNFWQNIPSMASSAWSSIKSGAFNTVVAVKNAFIDLWNGIGNGTLQFFGISYSNWQKFITNTTTLISRLFKGWVAWQKWQLDTAVSLLGKLFNVFKPVLNFIGDLFKDLFNTAGYFLNGVVQITWGFVKLIGQALAGFGKLFYQYMFTPWIEWQKWQLNFFGNIVKMFWGFGVNLISAFVNGIRSKINEAVGAVADMAGQIAEYLPHSPAKKGGLSMLDVNGQRFVETFIKGIESAGLTNFLNNAFVQPLTNANGLIPVAASSETSSGNQAPINITYNITARDSEDILKQLKARDRQLLELINRSNNRINRESY